MTLSAVVGTIAVAVASGARVSSRSGYEHFRREFGVERQDDSVSFDERAALFQQRSAEVKRHNSRPDRRWTAALNRFADFTDAEFRALLGHKPSKRRGPRSVGSGSFLQDVGDHQQLAFEVDWRESANATLEAKNQGLCGSCWAVAAAGALEVHAEVAGSVQPISYEQLVDCVENPDGCGGTGGCEGATTELAFAYVQEHGLSLASNYKGYQNDGDGSCRPAASPALTTTGFVQLPVNELRPLMEAVSTKGPVTVSVDGSDWGHYSHGVFDGCARDAVVNHAVLLVGYGLDKQSQSDFWLIRNSWGSYWGEHGFIRVLRHGTDQGEDGYCGTDHAPLDGVGCRGGPETLPVCGMCGILSDSAYPTGVKLVS